MALYDFVDTNEMPLNTDLPAEALCYNGIYIDEEISLFRTLYVSGRESFSAEIAESALESANGSFYRRKRLLPRTIIVGYQMVAESAEELMEAYNHLCYLMSETQVRVAFADEPDKFYIGTCKSVGTPDRGRLAVKAEIEIYCPDPCKYSVDTIALSPNPDGDFVAVYGGTYPAHPVFTATFTGDATLVTFTGDTIVKASGAFEDGDVLEIDCGSAKITLNGTNAPELGDIANGYEDMVLTYGSNVITPTYTGDSEPTYLMTYREAWL